MSTNFVQPGRTITIPSPADALAGEVVVAGSLIGVAANTAASGATLDLELEGVWALPKVAADAVALGAPVYYDAATKLVTLDDDDGANVQVGVAVAAAAASTGSVKVRLLG
jgi:predicted RecA/RadA family phage recombinase